MAPVDPVVALRRAVDAAPGRMVVIPRTVVDAVLALVRPVGPLVLLTPDDAERLARAAWDTATGDDERVARFGAWGLNPPDLADHQIDAARRTIAALLEDRP